MIQSHTTPPLAVSRRLQAITCRRFVELPSAISPGKSRPTLTIPQMIDRNNREVRRRRLTGTLESLTVASIYVFAMFCTALTLAIAIAERIYPWSL